MHHDDPVGGTPTPGRPLAPTLAPFAIAGQPLRHDLPRPLDHPAVALWSRYA